MYELNSYFIGIVSG